MSRVSTTDCERRILAWRATQQALIRRKTRGEACAAGYWVDGFST
jgi:hypothetical protein